MGQSQLYDDARSRPGTRRRIALYSHDTVGLGHLRRNLALASTLVAGPVPVDVLLVTGSREVAAFAVPRGIDCVVLPALAKRDGAYGGRTLCAPLQEVVALRSSIITAALLSFDPDVLIVDKVAKGVCDELEPALRRLKGEGTTRTVLGLRDVLDRSPAAMRDWRGAGTTQAVADFYDEVWVYGDPTVFDLVRECALPPVVADRVTFTGYLGHGRPRPDGSGVAAERERPSGPYQLCLVGGGQDGVALARAFAAAGMPPGTAGMIVTGPYMDRWERDGLRAAAATRGDLVVAEFVDDCAGLIAGAEAVVAMGGYNTVCELLAAGRRPLIVPRAHPRAEQLVRAEHLEQRGLVDLLHPDALTPERLGEWLAGGRGAEPPSGPSVELDGLARIPGLVERLLGRPASREVSHVAV